MCVCVLGYDHMHAACCKNTYLVQYQINHATIIKLRYHSFTGRT